MTADRPIKGSRGTSPRLTTADSPKGRVVSQSVATVGTQSAVGRESRVAGGNVARERQPEGSATALPSAEKGSARTCVPEPSGPAKGTPGAVVNSPFAAGPKRRSTVVDGSRNRRPVTTKHDLFTVCSPREDAIALRTTDTNTMRHEVRSARDGELRHDRSGDVGGAPVKAAPVPTPTALDFEIRHPDRAAREQHLDCSHRVPTCLRIAGRAQWLAFTCAGCAAYQPAERDEFEIASLAAFGLMLARLPPLGERKRDTAGRLIEPTPRGRYHGREG